MRRSLLLVLTLLAQPALARPTVDASPPTALAVSVYRDPEAGADDALDLQWLGGYALVSETRTVTLPAGEATVRFPGVVGGMVAVSALVTGLPGGTIEKNRNAALLSPAALVDGTLGNRVTVTRTNPATGAKVSEDAIVRTRADGALVLQTKEGFEAVGCAGVPQTLGFDRVPDGLLPVPVYSIDTISPRGGTYAVRLTYLASGFDWRAHYVASFAPGSGAARKLRLTAWLTMANENAEGLPAAELVAVAGKLEVTSDYRDLGEPPQGRPLSLTCYPLAIGGPLVEPPPPLPPPPPMAVAAPMMAMSEDIIVTAQRREEKVQGAPIAVTAGQENLGDLKLYRVPVPVDVAAKGLKQVAFLDREGVKGEIVHRFACSGYGVEEMDPADKWDRENTEFSALPFLFKAKNDAAHGLGQPLPMGKASLFEPAQGQSLLLGEATLRDYAVGEDVELELGSSAAVFGRCTWNPGDGETVEDGKWHELRAELSNANAAAISVELLLGSAGSWRLRGAPGKVRFVKGQQAVTVTVPPGERRTFTWQVRGAD